jgi:hypothetical protein
MHAARPRAARLGMRQRSPLALARASGNQACARRHPRAALASHGAAATCIADPPGTASWSLEDALDNGAKDSKGLGIGCEACAHEDLESWKSVDRLAGL